MHRIDTPTAQKDKFGVGKNGFTRGNPQTGTPATDLDDDYFDMLQEELAGVVEATGVVLDKTKRNQLVTAIRAIILAGVANASEVTAGTAGKLIDAAGLKSFLPKRAFAENDYIRIPDMPGGLIIQWGLAAATIGVASQKAYQIAFPTAALHVFLCHNVPNDANGIGISGARTQGSATLFDYLIQGIKVSGTSVTATASGAAAISMHYLAIGY